LRACVERREHARLEIRRCAMIEPRRLERAPCRLRFVARVATTVALDEVLEEVRARRAVEDFR
jgi:hypothetical protein